MFYGSCWSFSYSNIVNATLMFVKLFYACIQHGYRQTKIFLFYVGHTNSENSFHSVGASCVSRPKPKALRISAFKGNAQNDEPGRRASGSKSEKNSVKLKESEDTIIESSKANEVSVSYTSEANESVSSPAIHRLFKKWLTNLRTQSSNQVVDGIIGEEEPPSRDTAETEVGTEKKETTALLKAVWGHFLNLDATIKIPLLIL